MADAEKELIEKLERDWKEADKEARYWKARCLKAEGKQK